MKNFPLPGASPEMIGWASSADHCNRSIAFNNLSTNLMGQGIDQSLERLRSQEAENTVATFSRDLRLTLASLRTNPLKVNDGPNHYQILTDFFDKNKGLKRAIIGIPSRGCSLARSPWGGCTVCGHVSSSLWGYLNDSKDIILDFEKSLDAILNTSPQIICLYTSGSFLDPNELPIYVRDHILSRVAKIDSLETIVIESLPQFINEQVLDEICAQLNGKKIHIGIGLDSSTDLIRATLYQRNIATSKYQFAVNLCQKYQISTTAYVVLGNPLLAPEIALADTTKSIVDAFSLGFTEVSIEPIALQPSTLQDAFHKSGLYEPPTIWDIVTVLNNIPQKLHNRGGDIFLGGQVFTPLPYFSLNSCHKCTTKAINNVSFMRPEFWQCLSVAENAKCCTAVDLPVIASAFTSKQIMEYAQLRLCSLLD